MSGKARLRALNSALEMWLKHGLKLNGTVDATLRAGQSPHSRLRQAMAYV